MKKFPGFPANQVRYTHLPNLLFISLLPLIDDLDEMRVTLHISYVLARKRGFPRFVTLREMLAERALAAGMSSGPGTVEERVRSALARAVERGSLLHLALERSGKTEDLYLLNSESDRAAVEKIRRGEIAWPDAEVKPAAPAPQDKPSIYVLYEENVGLLTPLLAEEMREAEQTYPASWIEEAFRIAVGRNRRNWRYIVRILERWAAEGKDHGEHRRDTGEDGPPDKYIRGKYGHLVQH